MEKLRLKIDTDRLTVDDLIAIEEGKLKSRAARDLIARFVVDETEQPVEEELARKLVGQMPVTQMVLVGKQIAAQIMTLQEQALPPKPAVS